MSAVPTIGRRVYYKPTVGDMFELLDAESPCDAGIIYVHSPEVVNLTVTDHMGYIYTRRRVQQGSGPGEWDWMPYQKQQSNNPPAVSP